MTIKIVGLKRVKIGSITMPSRYTTVVNSDHTKQLAESIAAHGLIHEPVVRRVEGKLYALCGLHRIAAHSRKGLDEVMVKVVECTSEEAVDISEVENLERWHDPKRRAAELKARLDRLEKVYEGTHDPKEGRRGYKPRSARGKARAQVAAERGVKPDSVAKADRRAKAKEKQAEKDGAPPVETFGLELEKEFSDNLSRIVTSMERAANLGQQVLAALTGLQNANTGFPEGLLSRLRETQSHQNASISGAIPVCLCPWCKAVPELLAECTACEGLGYVGKTKRDSAPEELLIDGDGAVVMVRGKKHFIGEYLDEEEAEDMF